MGCGMGRKAACSSLRQTSQVQMTKISELTENGPKKDPDTGRERGRHSQVPEL
jgi:hypothetical protein